jgi:hypothetical protein
MTAGTHACRIRGGTMGRFRLSTLMLLTVIAALSLALVVQQQQAARREAELLVAFFAFLAGMLVLAASHSSREKPPELWELGPERRQEADSIFADYKAGKVVYTVVLPVLDTRIKARVVRLHDKGDYGFVPINELGPMPTHFWYYISGEFGLCVYNREHLFVRINEHYKWDHPGDCKYFAGSEGKER